MTSSSLEQSLLEFSVSPNYQSNYQLNTLGVAYVDNEGKINVQGSNRPEEHIPASYTMDQVVKEYLASAQGQRFQDYMTKNGKGEIRIEGRGAGDLGEHVVAAVMHDGEQGIVLGNYQDGKDFFTRVREFGAQYKLHEQAALEYVLTHEFGHVAGYDTEASNEAFIKDYFIERAAETGGAERQKYLQLAAVAEYRERETEKAN